MKYKNIEVGETYLYENRHVEVIFKHNPTKQVVTIDNEGYIKSLRKEDYKSWSSEHELPENGTLVFKAREDILAYRTGGNEGYGFTNGHYINLSNLLWSFNEEAHRWRTPNYGERLKFRQLLIEEAERRGIVKGVKIKCLHSGEEFVLGSPAASTYYIDGGSLWFKNRLGNRHVEVMNEGIWTEVINNKNK